MSVLARTVEHWDFSHPVPHAKGDWMRCPVCRSEDLLPKNCLYHEAQPGATHPYRCDLTMKCAECAAVWAHGIMVPEEVWAEYVPFGDTTRSIQRPEIRTLLAALDPH